MNAKRLYNLTNLEAVANGDKDFIKKMVTLFLQNTPAQSAELLKACTEENWQQVYFLAHKMKASINLVDIDLLKEEIKKVEANAKTRTELEMLHPAVEHIYKIIFNAAEQMKEDFDI